MRNRPRHDKRAVEHLRLAIDCLPVATREAMLAGLQAEGRIIAGAYVDEHGGVCPMLAAHRHGSRVDFLSFARSWDRFTRARSDGSRPATERELRILLSQLRDSLAGEHGLELDVAIREHRELCARSRELDRLARANDREPQTEAPQPRRRRRFIGDYADPRGPIRARRLRRSRRPVLA